jgi:hypothetical protein
LPVLYLDVDGVLQYADGDQWRPRLEAEAFLAWAVSRFQCRWLTNWIDPNRNIPRNLRIAVPPGIVEVNWRVASAHYPFKAAAIRDDEDWYWLEDEPSEFDLAELRRRKQMHRLIVVDRDRPHILMAEIRGMLEGRLVKGGK